MPAFLVAFGSWLARILFPNFLRVIFQRLVWLFSVSWRQVWAVVVKFLNKLTGGLFGKLVSFIAYFGGRFFWFLKRLLLTPWIHWFELVIAKPIFLLFVAAILFIVKFLANYFGYSLIGVFVYVVTLLLATVVGWLLDFIFTLIDFAPVIGLLNEWSNLPPCFVEIALAAGLGGALSALFSSAVLCIMIYFVARLVLR
jgi:hypothetical protein